MSNQKTGKSKRLAPAPQGRRKVFVLISLMLCFIIAGGVLAQWSGFWPVQKKSADREIAPASFAAAGPLKEYVYAGGKLVATEEPQSSSCTYGIAPTTQNFVVGGGTGTVSVTTQTGCNWTATSNAAWVSITSGASGTGNGSVGFSVAANSGAQRTGTMTIAGQTFTVTQDATAGCSYSINPTSTSIAASGGTGSVGVTTTAGCAWTAVSNAAWITVTSGSSGTGSGSVGYSVANNASTSQRTGTITIAGQTFTVTQAGTTPSCTYSIAPTSVSVVAGGGTGSVSVTTQAGCNWTATSNDAWITVTSGSSGTGSGTVNYSVAANSGAARSGTITIAGLTFSVSQSASGGGAPNAPTNLRTTSITASSVKLAWDHDGVSVNGFKLERKLGAGGTWAEIAGSINFQSRSYADNTVTGGKTYYYRIRAYNLNGNSAYSNEISATTP
jgi:hypothetical protein